MIQGDSWSRFELAAGPDVAVSLEDIVTLTNGGRSETFHSTRSSRGGDVVPRVHGRRTEGAVRSGGHL